jgi:hypothetical protein
LAAELLQPTILLAANNRNAAVTLLRANMRRIKRMEFDGAQGALPPLAAAAIEAVYFIGR